MEQSTVNVVVIVYDRFDNIKEWIRVWKVCNPANAQLIILHNFENALVQDVYRTTCEEAGALYIPRENVGFDIGAFQDVCRGRILLPAADYLLWCTDDLMPMRKGFVEEYTKHFEDPGVGVVAYEISEEKKRHVRTTGFMVRMLDLQLIQFPADPIIRKIDCYEFEHRGANALYEQVTGYWQKKAVQVCEDVDHTCMWDKGHQSRAARLRLRRRELEFKMAWPVKKVGGTEPLVTVICPIYKDPYPQIIASMLAQGHKNWKLILVHDGPWPGAAESIKPVKWLLQHLGEERITYRETPEHKGVWGHYIRQEEVAKLPDEGFVFITNADNHHTPNYIEKMLTGFKNDTIVGTYCSQMVHSYVGHGVIPCSMRQGYVDCAGVMVRAKVAKAVGWNHIAEHSSDWLFFKEIGDKYGMGKFARVEGCLLIHN